MTAEARPQTPRQRWMGVLARATRSELETAWAGLTPARAYEVVRGPEIGLVMVRGRAGGTGNPFNFGEVTVTRCAVRLADGTAGHCYAAGRDKRKAELAAAFDALLQSTDGKLLQDTVVTPIARRIERERLTESRKAAATKVEFFTMVRGDNPK